MVTESEKRTPVFDWETGDFVRDAQGGIVTVTEGAAMEQIAVKALNTARGLYLIYANVDDADLHHKYGNDVELIKKQLLSEEVRIEEFKRAVVEALIYDPWVTDVTDVSVSRTSETQETRKIDAAYINLTLSTIFDKDVRLERGLLVNG